jgi:hypothetical protein
VRCPSQLSDANESRDPQWFGYPDEESTWEKADNITRAKKLLKTFWADLGIDVTHFDGHEVHASEENIGE